MSCSHESGDTILWLVVPVRAQSRVNSESQLEQHAKEIQLGRVFASHKFDTTSKLCSQGILELLPDLLRQCETFPPRLDLNQLLWLYWGLQPIAIKLQWQSCGVGWRPLNTLITYMLVHKLREALDTSHFPSSFLTMSLSPTTWWSSRMGNTSETEGMSWQICWSQGSRQFGDQNECSFWINLCKLVGYLWVKILHPLCRSMSSSSGHVWQRYVNADQFADNTWMQTRWKWTPLMSRPIRILNEATHAASDECRTTAVSLAWTATLQS